MEFLTKNCKLLVFLDKCAPPLPQWHSWCARVNHQKPLGTGKFYLKIVWKTSKTNDPGFVLQERITFQNKPLDFNHDSRYKKCMYESLWIQCVFHRLFHQSSIHVHIFKSAHLSCFPLKKSVILSPFENFLKGMYCIWSEDLTLVNIKITVFSHVIGQIITLLEDQLPPPFRVEGSSETVVPIYQTK
jgi:hypothetical protein